MKLLPDILPPLGLDFRTTDGFGVLAVNAIAGQLLMFDLERSSAGTTSMEVGQRESGLCRLVNPTAGAAKRAGGVCVAMSRGTVGQRIRVRWIGIVYMFLVGQYSAGNVVVLNTGGTPLNGKVVYALVLESGGSPGMASLAKVVIDGDEGFSVVVGTSGVEPPPNGDIPITGDTLPPGTDPPGEAPPPTTVPETGIGQPGDVSTF